LVAPSVFQALAPSLFAGLTDLRIKIQPIGAYVINAIRIDTGSSSTLTTKSANITMKVDGVTVIDLQGDGDGVFADISADDITMTGDLTMDTCHTTISTAQTTDATATVIKSIPVGENKVINIDVDVIANEAGATKATYRLVSSFYRNAAGNVTENGSPVSIKSDEIDGDWACTLVANTTAQSVDVTVTGKAGDTVNWSARITYNIA
jgi:hypothetical protein